MPITRKDKRVIKATHLLASTESHEGLEVELGRSEDEVPVLAASLFMDSLRRVARSSLWARSFLSASKK